MRRNERRRLDEIERHLSRDDPDLARAMAETNPLRRVLLRRPPQVVLAASLMPISALCLVLGEGFAMFLAASTAVALFLLRDWSLRSR